MKTKLLLLFLAATTFVNAQFTLSEGFESATTPTGWVYTGFNRTLILPCEGTASLTSTYNSSIISGSVTTANYVSNGNSIDFSFSYKLLNTDNNFSPGAQVNIVYTVNNTTNYSFATFSTFSTTCQTWTGILPASTIPAGSNVKITIEVLRQSGYFIFSLDNYIASQTNANPTLVSTSALPSYDSAQINYSVNANNTSTTTVVNYGPTASDLSNQINGFSATGNANTQGSVTLSSLGSNSIYFYQVIATNSSGSVSSNVLSFTTGSFNPIIEYTFDNTLNNANGNEPFASNAGISYVQNRFGIADKAMLLNGTGTLATITNLPVARNSRTFSIWIRPTQVNSDNVMFSYGTGSGDLVYGASFNPTNIYNFSYASNLAYATSTVVNNWKHIVYTFEESTRNAKIYVNGVLANSGNFQNWQTQNNQSFYLGSLFGANAGKYFGYIDDLKVYNRALSANEINSLYLNNTILSSQNFNQNNLQVTLYPNPTNDVLNIEMFNEVKSIEIYNIQGRKVIFSTQNQINVSDLESGIYMIRIQDTNNAIATKKFVKQ